MPHPLQGPVVEVHVGGDEAGRQVIGVHRVAMVVGGDLHPPRGLVHHRVVGTPVAERQLVGHPPEGEGQELVAQAYAKRGQPLGKAPHGGQGGGGHLGIARPVAQKDPLGVQGEDVLNGHVGGDHGHRAVPRREVLEDVLLQAEVHGHHAERALRHAGGGEVCDETLGAGEARRERMRRLGRDASREILPIDAGKGGQMGLQLLHGRAVVAHEGLGRAAGAAVAGQGPRVHAAESHHPVESEVVLEAPMSAPGGGGRAQVVDDEACQRGSAALHVLGVHAIVSDVGEGHGHDLPRVAGVCEDLLVSHHGGGEDRLTKARATVAEPLSGENGPVFQQ